MNTPEATACPRCHTPLTPEDNFCRQCGRSLKPGYGFFYSHTGIILLALVLGPFALPCVLLSKRIGPVAKIIYTLLLVLLGIYLCIACYHIFQLTVSVAQGLMGNGF